MVDVQEWVNSKYPTKEEKAEVSELYLNEASLTGELDLSEFSWLRKIFISLELASTNLTFKNKPQEVEIVKLKNAQEWLDHTYPKKERKIVTRLNIGEKGLTGLLNLNDFIDLEHLDCSNNNLTSLVFDNCFHLASIHCHSNQLTKLEINNQLKLNYLLCADNSLTTLHVTNTKLTKLDCWCCSLTNLHLNNNSKLEKLNFQHNQLTESNFLNNLNESLISSLNVANNNLAGNLSIFSRFIECEFLWLGDNSFVGSLEHLQNLKKLKTLDIENTNLDSGLEYLPESLKTLKYIGTKFEKELRPYSGNVKAWKINQQLSHPSKRGWKYDLNGISIAPFIPSREKREIHENYLLRNITYSQIIGSKDKLNHWVVPEQASLPIKLYHLPTETVIWTKNHFNIKNYAIISYFWGNTYDQSLLVKKEYFYQVSESQKEIRKIGLPETNYETTKWTIKALAKATEACQLLGIDYLWIDQLCINQLDNQEVNQEVPKMRQYYNNAAVTLITIQCNLYEEDPIDVITNSQWFTRSWTFQEGWLSKHTIFMFDDCLVDGRELAVDWILSQPGYSEYASINLGEKGLVKAATPIGWVYFKDGYQPEDKVSLTLSQVLRGVQERKRFLPIDGIYSILGLLPYGDRVVPKYRESGYRYNHSDLVEALYDVIKVAWENGYGEALAWHGAGHSLVPEIRSVQEGSIEVAGGIFIKRKSNSSNSLTLNEKGLLLRSYVLIIKEQEDNINKEERGQGFLIDSGLCTKSVQMKVDGDKLEEIKLWGTRETLEKIQIDHTLLIPDPKDWESNIPFGLLAQKQGNSYQRIGLVEIRNEIEKLTVGIVENVTISLHEYIEAKKLKRVATILEQESFKKVKENNRIKDKEEELEDLINSLVEENDKNVRRELVNNLLIKKEQLVRLEVAIESNNNNHFTTQIQTSLQN